MGYRRIPRISISRFVQLARFIFLRIRRREISGGMALIGSGAEIRVERGARIQIGKRVRIASDFTAYFHGGTTRIGDGVFFNRGNSLSAWSSVEIGNNCQFGEYVSIHEENHQVDAVDPPRKFQGYVTAPIRIGENVWVGAKATILPGVSIGDNSVIGANSVVTRDIPANVVAAGAPARVIREIRA